jgi:hypothetical protein
MSRCVSGQCKEKGRPRPVGLNANCASILAVPLKFHTAFEVSLTGRGRPFSLHRTDVERPDVSSFIHFGIVAPQKTCSLVLHIHNLQFLRSGWQLQPAPACP